MKTPYDRDNPRYNGLPPHIWEGLRAAFLQGFAAGKAEAATAAWAEGFNDGWKARAEDNKE